MCRQLSDYSEVIGFASSYARLGCFFAVTFDSPQMISLRAVFIVFCIFTNYTDKDLSLRI